MIEQGAELNVKNSSGFVLAAKYCDKETLIYLAEQGADIHAQISNKVEAFEFALYGGERLDILETIHNLGHTVMEYGGEAFIDNIENIAIREFFISHGIDINYQNHRSHGITALHIAREMETITDLLGNNADVKIADSYGARPYHYAVIKEMRDKAKFLKSLEPSEFHDVAKRQKVLEEYNLDTKCIDFLKAENPVLEIDEEKQSGYEDYFYEMNSIEFFTLTDVIVYTVNDEKYLRLSKNTSESIYDILWNPRTKQMVCFDIEHLYITDIGTFDEFMENPLEKMTLIFEMEDEDYEESTVEK